MATDHKVQLAVESTCQLARPYDDVFAYITNEWTRAVRIGKTASDVLTPVAITVGAASGGALGGVDAAVHAQELKSEQAIETQQGTVEVSIGGDNYVRFAVTAINPTTTQVTSTYFTTSRILRYMPGTRQGFKLTLKNIERKMRKWAG